jgi:hypothetical protein
MVQGDQRVGSGEWWSGSEATFFCPALVLAGLTTCAWNALSFPHRTDSNWLLWASLTCALGIAAGISFAYGLMHWRRITHKHMVDWERISRGLVPLGVVAFLVPYVTIFFTGPSGHDVRGQVQLTVAQIGGVPLVSVMLAVRQVAATDAQRLQVGRRLVCLRDLHQELQRAAYTGLRRGEPCALRWSDLDADGQGLSVRHNLVEVARDQIPAEQRRCVLCGGEHVGRDFKGPKSRAGRRWVPLAAPAQTAVRRQRADQALDRRRPYRDHDLVFCLPDGDPLRPNAVSAEFTRLVRQCGLPPIRLHDLRHGTCSLLLAGGVPWRLSILGHAAPTVTRRVYAHILRDPTTQQVNQALELVTRHRQTMSR